jgi:hypothetical protein
MSSTRLIRWSGAALAVAGILAALSFLFHPLVPELGDMQTPRWLAAHALSGIAFIFMLPGFAGLYAHVAEKSGALGLAGFVLVSIASALMGGLLLFVESVLLPVASTNPAFVSLTDPASEVYRGTLALPLFLGTSLLFAVGFVLLGMTVVRSSSLPKLAGYLLIAGGVFFSLPVPPVPVLFNTTGMVLLGAGLANVGYALWRGNAQKVVGANTALGTAS